VQSGVKEGDGKLPDDHPAAHRQMRAEVPLQQEDLLRSTGPRQRCVDGVNPESSRA
jgi:hypothetical protein